MQGDIAQQPPESPKYLVVVTSRVVDEGLPRYLKTKFVIHWPDASTDERNHQILLRELYNVSKIPPIGERPVFV